MSKPIEFDAIQVNDRIRATQGSDVVEMIVTHASKWVVESDNLLLEADDGWSCELLDRPPLPEPTYFGTVVDFDDELEGLRKRAVLAGHPAQERRWYDPSNEKWWAWKAMKNPEVVGPGVEA